VKADNLRVRICERCGSKDLQLVTIMRHYRVMCDNCVAVGAIEKTAEKAVVAWNEKQDACPIVRMKGNDLVH
jgi:late competence protein required for DNA uptake (superfamily II DNA/RNA helicase)